MGFFDNTFSLTNDNKSSLRRFSLQLLKKKMYVFSVHKRQVDVINGFFLFLWLIIRMTNE